MILPDDTNGYNPFTDSACKRINIRFEGRLKSGKPFIGGLTFEDANFKYTLEGKFNS